MSSALLSKSNQSFVVIALFAATLSACNRGPAAVRGPSISASGASSKAMELYDKDGDGKIAGAELEPRAGSRPRSRISIRTATAPSMQTRFRHA